MVCSWGCLCRWRREHPPKEKQDETETFEPLPEKSPDAVRAMKRAMSVTKDGMAVHGKTVTNFDRWKLAGLRAEREMCRETLQRLSGITIGGIRNIENGKSHPRPETVRKLAAAFGVEPKELLKD